MTEASAHPHVARDALLQATYRVVTPDGYGVTCLSLEGALREVWRLDDEGREPHLSYFDGERFTWAPAGIRQWRVPDPSTLPQTPEEGRAYIRSLDLEDRNA